MKIILTIILAILGYIVGYFTAEEKTLIKIKTYIKKSKDWNEFMEKLSVDFNEWNIGE